MPEQGAGRLIQVADLFGEHGVSFLVAMTNGVLLDLLLRPWVNRPRFGRKRSHFGVRESMVLWTLVYVAALIYGHYRLKEWEGIAAAARAEDSVRRPMVVATVQTNIAQNNKERRTLDVDRRMWGELESLTHQAAAGVCGGGGAAVELIVWPETMAPASINVESVRRYRASASVWRARIGKRLAALEGGDSGKYWRDLAESFGVSVEGLPGYLAKWDEENAACRARIAALAKQVDTPLLVGASTEFYDDRGQSIRRYNSAYLSYADGRYADERYDKMYRVPFGEYVPWVEWWPWLKEQFIRYLTPYDHDYSLNAGTERTVFRVARKGGGREGSPGGEVRVCTPICFEDTIWRLCRSMVYGRGWVKRAQVLANLTNDGWFAGYAQGYQQFQIAVLRCVENRVPMVRSVNTGVSGMISSAGVVGPVVTVDGRRENVSGVVCGELVLDDRRSLFGWWGHVPVAVVAGCTLSATLLGALGGKRRARRTDR